MVLVLPQRRAFTQKSSTMNAVPALDRIVLELWWERSWKVTIVMLGGPKAHSLSLAVQIQWLTRARKGIAGRGMVLPACMLHTRLK